MDSADDDALPALLLCGPVSALDATPADEPAVPLLLDDPEEDPEPLGHAAVATAKPHTHTPRNLVTHTSCCR